MDDDLFAQFLGELKDVEKTAEAETEKEEEQEVGPSLPPPSYVSKGVKRPADFTAPAFPSKMAKQTVVAKSKPQPVQPPQSLGPSAVAAAASPMPAPVIPEFEYTAEAAAADAEALANYNVGGSSSKGGSLMAARAPSPSPPRKMPYEQQMGGYNFMPPEAPAAAGGGVSAAAAKPTKKFLRAGGGEMWVDPTLAEWPDNDYRIFVGDIGNEVTDESLGAAFAHYPSYAKARVVRNCHTKKGKGYGFISFLDGLDMMKAMREMQGKYLGSRPMKLRKSTWKDRSMNEIRKKERKIKKTKAVFGL